MWKKILDWLDEETDYRKTLSNLLDRKIPKGVNWWYTLGSATLFLFVLQVTTGIFLALYYSPSPEHAFHSVEFIMNKVPFGSLVRGVHHWAASGMVILVFLHVLRVFFYGAYKYPRELSWVVGVMLLIITLAFGFTGYLLPWAQKSYWATVVGTNIVGTVPFLGEILLKILRGGAEVGTITLSRFFVFHTLILPAAAVVLIAIHLFLVVKKGISAPPEKPGEPPITRETYHEKYEKAKEEGETFFPYTLFKDAVVVFLVFLVVGYFALFVKIPVEELVNPLAAGYVPRPEWYFLWLFQLLWYFKGPLEMVGTFILPTAVILLLFLLPFIDRNPGRSIFKRPLATFLGIATVFGIGYLTYLGTTAPVSEIVAPAIAKKTFGKPLTAFEFGRQIYSEQGCSTCHSIKGVGGSFGLDLSNYGAVKREKGWLVKFLRDPVALQPGISMPATELPSEKLKALAEYLMNLK